MTGPERVLFVHAHPDDESIATGGTIATLVDRGAAVTVLTCTRGERGEVIPPELAHFEGSPDLVAIREDELRGALRELGVSDSRFLGALDARRPGLPERMYLDSGMRWGADGPEPVSDPHPESLCAADLGEVAADIAAVILDVDPDVVVSYDERGGYGHPDHIRVHQAARRAAEVLRVPFYAVLPAESELEPTTSVDVRPVLERKRRALAAHRTQVVVDRDSFQLSNGEWHPIDTTESFRRLRLQTPDEQPSVVSMVVAGVLALALGAALGVLGTTGHQYVPPIGILLSLTAVAGLIVGLRLIFDGRTVPLAAALGVIGAEAALAMPGMGGSVLIPSNGIGYAWTLGPVLIAVVALGWPRIERRGRRR
ncbi:PIG-L family deacetylase [Lysobacter korlensis]|uniref:PIG-L family deacetylase n=1 Tax=Lysobacter korlensis TaxID=553636 RepID=A0ABV6RZ52_9GAMM